MSPSAATGSAYLRCRRSSRAARGGAHVGSIRRVIVTTFGDSGEDEIAWVRRALPGQELTSERTKPALGLAALLPRATGSFATTSTPQIPGRR